MRTSVIAGLLMLGLVGLGLRAQKRSDRPLVGFAAEVAHAQPARAPQRQSDRKITVRTAQQPQPIWRAEVTGEFKKSAAAAHQDALRKAAVELGEFMRERYPGFRYEPTPKFVEENGLVVDARQTDHIIDAPGAPTMLSERLTLELRDNHLAQLLQEDRRERGVERLWTAGRILAGLVIALLTLVAYVRVDDWTKGYLSTALKFAAIALAVAGAALAVIA